ncbi:winged helix DNA-binding domain-containing protein [Streptomyces abyssomicinicus]|uniref:winged helix DNA-binding domain-containing protein n=1 Tax=Streptomyces abyssomicinicus TaxID=574929 RepID=UPI0013DF286A|nr:winged helix DNA-binding domain-containing protein [Streptomyces abyssomicinicus]
MKLTQEQVLAWRLRRQSLAPRTTASVAEIVGRLAGVQAQVASSAELAITTRQRRPAAGAVEKALDGGEVVKTWAMRGTLHLLTPGHLPAYLSLMAAARTWEKPSWQRAFGVTPAQMTALGEAVDEVLDGRTMTRQELTAALVARAGFAGLEEQLTSGWGAVLKPLAWTGKLCHGPGRGNRITFASPRGRVPGWAGVPEPEEAARTAVPAYLGAHGPATPEVFDAWLTRGASRKAALRGWFASLGEELARVEVDGTSCWARAEDLDALAAARPSREVRLLPGFDQYVLGAGTSDTRIVGAERRKAVSRASGWISPVVVHRGRVVGVWEFTDDTVDVQLFGECPQAPREALEAEVAHLAACTGRAAALSVRTI